MCFHLNSKSYPITIPDVFPLGFLSRSIAIWYASYHIQNRSVPTPSVTKIMPKKNLFQWKQNAYPIWKLERSDCDLVWSKHSIIQQYQHKSTRINTSQQESTRVSHESTRVQHKSTQINISLTRINTSLTLVNTNQTSPTQVNTSQTRANTNQHESYTSQHESVRPRNYHSLS